MARNFNSNTDRVNFGSGVFDFTSNWSISTWIRRTTVNRSVEITPIWSRWTSSSASRQLYVYFLPATSGANVDKIQVDVPFVANILTGSTAISDTNWHHVAITRSGNDWTLYLDGVSDGTATVAATQETGGELTLGDTIVTGTGAGDLLGDQAEVAGWDTVLDVDDTRSLSLKVSPLQIHPEKLEFYSPVWGRASPEQELMARDEGTVTGTTRARHLPISIGRSSLTIGFRRPSVSVTATVLSATFSIQTPSATGDARFDATVLTATFSTQGVTVTGGATASQTALSATFSTPAPTVTGGATITIVNADVLVATFSIPPPTATGGSLVTASVLTATFSIQAPTVSFLGDTTVTPLVLSATFTLVTPSVVTDIFVEVWRPPARGVEWNAEERDVEWSPPIRASEWNADPLPTNWNPPRRDTEWNSYGH